MEIISLIIVLTLVLLLITLEILFQDSVCSIVHKTYSQTQPTIDNVKNIVLEDLARHIHKTQLESVLATVLQDFPMKELNNVLKFVQLDTMAIIKYATKIVQL